MSINNEDTDEKASQSLISGCGTRLVLTSISLYFLITIYSTIFAIGSFFTGITAGFAGRDTLICNRNEISKIDCELKISSFLKEEIITISGLQEAKVDITTWVKPGKGSTQYSYQIFLVAETGNFDVLFPKSSFDLKDETIFKPELSYINDFINNPDKNSIRIEEKGYALAFIKRGIFWLIIGWFPWITFLGYFYIVLITLEPTNKKS
jgi:hypothetical protein